ncbi:MAG: DUF2851 family protein [Chitinophagaceae bacterium]
MTERLLQFIWQFQYFNKRHLHTADGESLQIIQPGQFNSNQGPDFLDARIRIGDTILAGNIELHLNEADWNRHAHQHDPNYRNIILHVLWDQPLQVQLALPTISIKDRVPKLLLQRYEELMHNQSFVPCANSLYDANGLQQVSDLVWLGWKERLLVERLLRKTAIIEQYLVQSNNHWEEVCWWMLARNFGIPINADAFEAVARSLPLTLLARHRTHLHQLEALLLGQAGLLNKDFEDAHASMLAKEYRFYKTKYQLQPLAVPVHFLRMRPGNFPTIRLAQLAMLLHTTTAIFSQLKEGGSAKDLCAVLQVTAGDYWHTHYRLDEATAFNKKTLGSQTIENIIINTVAPVLFAYGYLKQEPQYTEKALDMLEQLGPEKNAITQQWSAIGMLNQDAWDSQALIELKKEYCDKKRCLECVVGNSLLKGDEKHQPAGSLTGQLNSTFTSISGCML